MKKSKMCYIDSEDGWSIARKLKDDSAIPNTGSTLMCISRAEAELLGYTVINFDKEASDEEMEYGFK
jgi:hypothetical protein